MALQYNRINDIVLIDLADNQGYTFNSASISSCGDSLHTKGGGLDLPIYQSYNSSPSKGLQLTARMSTKEPLLQQLFDIDLDETPPIRITKWNVNENTDVFPVQKTAAIVAETIRAKMPDVDFATGWPDIVAGAMIKEVGNLKNAGGKGANTKFTDAVNDAMYENQSPKQSLSSIMKLKTFCVQAGRGMLGLGTNGGGTPAGLEFNYNFGASLLFNPDLYISEKGIGRISIKAQYSSGNKEKDGEPETICGKAIVIYNSTRNNSGASLSGSNLSFAFRPDDTFSDDTALKNEIMAAARTFSTNAISEGQLAQLNMTQANWNAGTGWTSPEVIIEGGLRVKTGLNPPRSQGAGVFNVGFSFNFGSENGSLTISNLLLSFTFDIAKYAQSVNAVQQAKARYREALENYKRALAARAAALAAANKTEVGTEAPITKVDLDSNLNTTTNYTTRDENAANVYKNDGNILDGTPDVTAPVDNINQNNDNNDGYITTESDVILGG
jgi:hypothetical protein